MPEIVLVSPDDGAMRSEMVPLLAQARALTVSDLSTHEIGLTLIAGATRTERRVKELFAEPKRKAHDAHRAICDAEGKLLAPLAEAKRLVGGKCLAYEAEQRRLAAERQRELEAAGRRQEEERRLNEAVAAEAAGDNEGAEAILEEKPTPVVVHVEAQVAKVEGVSERVLWSAEVTDKAALVRYVAERPAWLNLLDPNMPALNALARSAREALNVPGVRPVSTVSRAVRG